MPYSFFVLVGAMLSIAVLSAILAYTVFRKLDAPLKQRCSLISSCILSIVIAGYGLAEDGGPPQFFEAAETFGTAAVLVAGLGWRHLAAAKFRDRFPYPNGDSLIHTGITFVVLLFVFCVIAYGIKYVVAYGITKYKNYHAELNMVIEKEIKEGIHLAEKVIEEAINQDTPNRTESEKLFDAIDSFASQQLEEMDSVIEAENYAATAFIGTYAIQQAIYDYCKSLGADLTVFLNEYKRVNAIAYQKSDRIYKENGSSVEKYFAIIQDHLPQYTKQDMNNIKKMANEQGNPDFTLVDSCLWHNEIASEPNFPDEWNFSIAFPRLYRILINSCQGDIQGAECPIEFLER